MSVAWPESAADLLRTLIVRGGGSASGRAGMWLYERKYIAPVRAGYWVATEKGVAALPMRNPKGKAPRKPAKKPEATVPASRPWFHALVR